MRSRAPIFLGGLMRSGTTLFRAMLGQHSAVASGLETHWFEIDWDAQRGRNGEPMADYLHRIGAFFDVEATIVDHLMATVDSAPAYLDAFMSEVARRMGKRRWAEKTTANVRVMDRIFEYWPDAQFVHIVRDPKDVFASFRRSNKYGGAADYGNLWCDFFADLERFKREIPLGREQLLEVRYENLVLQPAREMRRALDFLGEDWEPAVAIFQGNRKEYDKVVTLTGHASSTLESIGRPLSRDRIGVWSEVIDEDDLATARAVVARHGLGDLFARIESETLAAGAVC